MPKQMLRQPKPPRPTNAELQILRVLWQRGPSTVRDVTASEAATRRRMVTDLAKRAFGGSTVRLVLHALAATPATAPELDQIRKLLDEKKKGEPS